MNEQQLQAQNVWFSNTKSYFQRPGKSQFTTANGVLSIVRDGVQQYSGNLATLQVSTKGFAGVTLVKNEQGELVRLMFASPLSRFIAVSPLLVLMTVGLFSKIVPLEGISILALAGSMAAYRALEARSPVRKQFMATIEAAGGQLGASIIDTQVEKSWSLGLRIGLAICTPLLCLVWSALIYAVIFAILQSVNLMSPDSAFAPKVILYVVLFIVFYKPTHFILTKAANALIAITKIK